MTDTTQLSLPLLAPAQAQKHVTVNEALARLDGLTQLSLVSRSVGMPPGGAEDGTAYSVPAGAAAEWSGHGGEVAVRANGGWVFAAPGRGWRGFIADEGASVVFDGTKWVAGLVSLSPSAAGAAVEVLEFDHAVPAGGAHDTATEIPADAIVFGVTGRVTEAIDGTLTSWSLGSGGVVDRFGSGLGLAAGSYARGLLSSPTTGYAPAPLTLTPAGGDFAGGTVRLAVHCLALRLPEE